MGSKKKKKGEQRGQAQQQALGATPPPVSQFTPQPPPPTVTNTAPPLPPVAKWVAAPSSRTGGGTAPQIGTGRVSPPPPSNIPPAPPLPDPSAPKKKFANAPPPPASASPVMPCKQKALLRVKVTDQDMPTRLIPNAHILVQDSSQAEVSRGMSTLTDEYQRTDDLEPGTYTVTIRFEGQDALLYKIEAPGPSQSCTLAAGEAKVLEFKVTPLIRIYLKFQFLDPDADFADKVRVFPKGLAVQLYMQGTEKIEAIIGDDGIMLDGPDGKNYIEAKRSKKWFNVKFEQPARPFVVVEAYDADAAEKPALLKEDAPFTKGNDLQKKVYEKKRVCMFPKTKWTMKNSDWDVSQAPTFSTVENKFEKLDILSTRVGEDGSPALLTLNPHWQYLRFEYFDRYYGMSDHDKKPISSLPVFLEGYAEDVSSETSPALDKLTTLSSWAVTKDKDTTKFVQALPWIIRADDANKENANPNQKSVLRFCTDEDHRFLKSTDKDTREWKKLADTDADYKPVAGRLRYYDLPEEWRSTQYFCRFSEKEADQEFYEEMARKGTSQAQPLIFSLDDLVLTDKDPQADRLALRGYRSRSKPERSRRDLPQHVCGRRMERRGAGRPGRATGSARAAGPAPGAKVQQGRAGRTHTRGSAGLAPQ